MLWFFSLTLFLSAFLLFFIEPMVAKMVLPLLGGTPAVWNTCMVFFQATLLLGYLYAHVTSTWLTPRRQIVLHLLVLLVPFLVLPVSFAAWGAPPGDANPIPWLLLMLAATIGPPFFVISTSAPILQKWFAHTGHPAARDPYFLYGASNVGSMIALLGYPLVIEPQLRLVEQSWIWLVGYGAFVVAVGGCALLVWRSLARTADLSQAAESEPDSSAGSLSEGEITWLRRLRWIALGLVPSSLLLGFTTYLTTDIAAIPLLWVAPLAVYLLTFILVFAQKPPLPHWLMIRLLPLALLPSLVLLLTGAIGPLWMVLPAHFLTFFLTSMVCHGELARDRPAARHLTEFYLWMSLGGMVGGLFNALLAPVLFDSVAEYPLVLVLMCWLLPRSAADRDRPLFVWGDLGLAFALALVGLGVLFGMDAFAPHLVRSSGTGSVVIKLVLAIMALLCFPFSGRPVQFGMGVAAVSLVGFLSAGYVDDVVYATRSFFGVHRVMRDVGPTGESFHKLVHGNTSHGLQSLDPARRRTPLAYYYPTGPLGLVFADLERQGKKPHVAVVGLGSGAIACFIQPGQRLTFYEIDPSVVRIAQDPKYFTFLADARGAIDIVLGDGRLTLAQAPVGAYGLIVVDAFSSDAIPLHLTTREAVQLYLSKLAPDGVLLFHISNRYLDLEPVLGDLAADARIQCMAQAQYPAGPVKDDEQTASEGSSYVIPKEEEQAGKAGSHYVIMSRQPESLVELAKDVRWRPVEPRARPRIWTDDFSNIFSVLK